ncbi:ATP-dependent RNA helicase DDX49 [Sarcoptes scabiei]|nr:ATP-dependent RNA helicase DDX49 [Sarcoptes scabiei]
MKRNARKEENDCAKRNDTALKEIDSTDIHADTSADIAIKTNRFGLGYKGMLRSNESAKELTTKNLNDTAVMATMRGGRLLKISGQAFGYGALEDDDAIDIYSNEDLSQYDFELDDSKQAKKIPKKPFGQSNLTNQLDGFHKTKSNFDFFLQIKQRYPLPLIPKDWKPKRRRNVTSKNDEKRTRWDRESYDGINRKKTQSSQASISTDLKTEPKTLNANLRAVILGENIVHKTGVIKNTNLDTLTVKSSTEQSNLVDQYKNLPKKSSLYGFFASKFTHSTTNSGDPEEKALTAGLNNYEKFQNSSLLSSSSANVDDKNDKIEEKKLKPIRVQYEWHPHKTLCKRFGVQNPFPQYPDVVGIVCMNQSDRSRNMIARLSANNKSLSSTSKFGLFDSLNQSKSSSELSISNSTIESEASKSLSIDLNKSVSIVSKNSDDIKSSLSSKHQKNDNSSNIKNNSSIEANESIDEQESNSKPSMDLFRSIFASDEEDDDDDNDTNDQKKDDDDEEEKGNSLEKDHQARNYQKSSGGIFSGIDFDHLENNFNPHLLDQNDDKDNDCDTKVDEDDDCYGPVLPPPSSYNDLDLSQSSSKYNADISMEYREKKSRKKSKKISENHRKRKSSSKNHKKSSKKYRRHRKKHSAPSSLSSSSSTSTDDDND